MPDNKALTEKIARARQLLTEIHHVPVSTTNEDGSPHSSPVFMAFDKDLNGYWASHPDSLHSVNIARDERVFLVVFDSREGHGGLFIEARAVVVEDRSQVAYGYNLLKELKTRFYGTMGELNNYTGDGSQRIYRAEPVRLWVNKSQRNQSGAIIRDRRY